MNYLMKSIYTVEHLNSFPLECPAYARDILVFERSFRFVSAFGPKPEEEKEAEPPEPFEYTED